MSTDFSQIQNDIVNEIKSNRKSWNLTEIPRLCSSLTSDPIFVTYQSPLAIGY